MTKQKTLIQTFINGRMVSTMYRMASTTIETWYFETLVWEWDDIKKQRGEMLDMRDSGGSKEIALDNHARIVEKIGSDIRWNY